MTLPDDEYPTIIGVFTLIPMSYLNENDDNPAPPDPKVSDYASTPRKIDADSYFSRNQPEASVTEQVKAGVPTPSTLLSRTF